MVRLSAGGSRGSWLVSGEKGAGVKVLNRPASLQRCRRSSGVGGAPTPLVPRRRCVPGVGPIVETRTDRANSGVTLVELLVALGILSVVLTAVAASLISFTQQSAVNEHRVQATAYLTSLHENLQAIPWNRVALYDEEYPALEEVGVDLSGPVPQYQGEGMDEPEDLVTIPGPVNEGCPDSDPECGRLAYVPRATDTVTIDGREFELFQIVTERSVGGEGEPNIRRFITIVRWTMLGRDFEEVFQSERAPTPAERAEAAEPDVRLFLFSPRRVELDENGFNRDTIEVFARFQPGISSAQIQIPTVGGTTTLELDPVDEFGTGTDDARGFALTLESRDYEEEEGGFQFLEGEQTVQLFGSGELGSIEFPGGFPIDVIPYDPDNEVLDRDQPTVDVLDPTAPITIEVGTIDGVDEDRICSDVTFKVDATGDPEDIGEVGDEEDGLRVTSYFSGDRFQSRSMDLELWSEADVAAEFWLTLQRGDRSPWLVEPGEQYTDRFYFIAGAGIEGRTSAHVGSGLLTISKPDNSACPDESD